MTPGKILREKREEKGLTVEKVSSDTRILKEYIEALERDDYPALPSETHVKGFLRKYSAYLGLDPDQIISLYERETEEQRVSLFRNVVGNEAPALMPYVVSVLLTAFFSILLLYLTSVPSVKETLHPSVKAQVRPIVLEVGPLPRKESVAEMRERLNNLTREENATSSASHKPVVPIFTPSSPVQNTASSVVESESRKGSVVEENASGVTAQAKSEAQPVAAPAQAVPSQEESGEGRSQEALPHPVEDTGERTGQVEPQQKKITENKQSLNQSTSGNQENLTQ